jgi:DNA-binding CsgD family transcriptional regulator
MLIDKYKSVFLLEYELNLSYKKDDKTIKFIEKLYKALDVHEKWESVYRIYGNLFDNIRNRYPEALTDTEFKICCLTCINFNNTEIAIVLDLKDNTIAHTKSKIRQKFNLGERGDIRAFFEKNGLIFEQNEPAKK